MFKRTINFDAGILQDEDDQRFGDYDKGSKAYLKNATTAVKGAVKVIYSRQVSGELEVTKTEDHTQKIPYSLRLYDALARLFNDGTCAAVSKVQDHLYISYNNTASGKDKERVSEVLTILKDQSKTYRDLFTYCMQQRQPHYNPKNYYRPDKKDKDQGKKVIFDFDGYKNAIDGLVPDTSGADGTKFQEDCVAFLKLSREVSNDFDEFMGIIGEINASYNNLCTSLNEIENIGAAEKAQIKECLADAKSRMLYFRERLVSDCYKVKYCFDKDADLRKLVVDESSYCSNDKKIHAELNLRAFLKENNIYPVYVGISKPSCLTCHTQFQIDEEREVKLLHIGTHGVSYIIDSADLPDDTLFDSEFVFRITHRAFHKSSVDNPQFRPIDPADQNLSISPIGETFYSSDSHGFYIPVYLGEY